MGLPLIIAEMHSQEYNVYFRAMRQRPAALDLMGNQGQSGSSLLSFREWALSALHILLLLCTPTNILCILEPLKRGQQPPIRWVLKGRQFLAAEIPGVGTMGLTHIIAEMHSQEYNVYFGTLGQRL